MKEKEEIYPQEFEDIDEYIDDEYYYDNEKTQSDDFSVQYLTFFLNDEIYGIDVKYAKEVIKYSNVYIVPNVPDYIHGVFNLRGKVIPIINLSLRLFNKKGTISENSCIVIIDVNDDTEIIPVGVIVDAIQAIVNLPDVNIEPAPKVGTKIRSDYISGVGKSDDGFIILLDSNNILKIEELSNFS